MSDPLSDVVRLLRPRAVVANLITGKGDWAVRYAEYGLPSFCIVLAGDCRLAVDGQEPVTIQAGDFVLLPTTPAFTLSSRDGGPALPMDPHEAARAGGELRYGERRGRPDMRSLGGAFEFEGGDAALLVSLLPRVVHVRGSERLALLVRLVGEEALDRRPGGEFMLSRLVEVMLIEAMRATAASDAPAGLLRGLADERLARALAQMHAQVARSWTVAQLARSAALSRSVFYERFTRTVGVPPMEYLLAWRMAIAKELLRSRALSIAEVAERVGYGSASTFSTAFSRHVGLPPSRYART
ncbi:AraC family transcriptional regulator [Mitsuaria sp. GD03876]|uniref:AraC family transcriptional regulator n=1 Tax=Mitsuaria sp. GD03876 TaxID=2975399 RepID=UPI002447BD14|nr:AraC family transcriptional regulator [Mitsuaria sp. GD03876]MDH0866645.1 AraC family transcriptional regulator [Mitsuaria sp. GD03876]